MLTVTQQDRHEVANSLASKPIGFVDKARPLLVLRGFCPDCAEPVESLRDELSMREWRISGLCQSCQDSLFGADDGEAIEVATDPAALQRLTEGV